MTRYLIDTNILVYLETPSSPFHNSVKERFQQLYDEDQLYVSVLSLYELNYGAALKRKKGEEGFADLMLLTIEEIKKRFDLLPLNGVEARTFGEIKAHYKEQYLKKEEKQISIKKNDIDFLIASIAIEYDLVLASNDRIFEKIKELFTDLHVDNWAEI
jgi:predicted nucleic acid-binding protein